MTQPSENPVINAIEAGHGTREKDIDPVTLEYLSRARCKHPDCHGGVFPCAVVLAARAANSRRLAAQSRATLRSLTPQGA